jgi:hypothetical protein
MSSFNTDRLVLFIEEEYSKEDVIDDNYFGFSFFILYDENEREYFITGQSSKKSQDFKFYCKKTKNIYKYIKSLMLDDSIINMALYNFNNLYEDNEYVDFTVLQEMTDTVDNELQGYFGVTDKDDVTSLLKLLKRVRY